MKEIEVLVGYEVKNYEKNGQNVEYKQYYIKVEQEKLKIKLTEGELAKNILNRLLGE